MSELIATRLGLRIGLAFAGLVLLTLLFGLLMGNEINHSYQQLAQELSRQHRTYSSVQTLRADFGDLRRFEKDVFLAVDIPEHASFKWRQWNQELNQAYVRLGQLEQTLPEQKPLALAQLRSALDEYKNGFLTVAEQVLAGRFRSAEEANRAFLFRRTFIHQYQNAIDALIHYSEQQEQLLLRQLDEIRVRRLWQLAGALCTLLIISSLVAVFITRNSLRVGRELEYQATHDSLTKLLNRRGFEMQLASAHRGAILYLDLDQFKLVNDLCGHSAGDELLSLLALRFGRLLPTQASMARFGGDEFCIFLPNADASQASELAQQLLREIQNYPFVWQGRLFSLSGALGIAIADGQQSLREHIMRADTACAIAKERGTGQIAFATEVDQQHHQLQSQMSWAAQLPQMLQQDRFVLFIQHMQALKSTGAPHSVPDHAEILIRALDEQGEPVPPGQFLPAAERFGLIGKIDRWVTRTILQQALPPHTIYGINLSAASLGDHAFLHTLREWIQASPTPAQQWCFEITETAAMTDIQAARHFVSTLKQLGCRFALDDFGSGFSSFSYLKELDVDYLKIDGSLIRNLERNASDLALVTAVVQMAKALRLKIVAEFVENHHQLEILRDLGVDYAQGYAVHRPAPLLIQPVKET
ncbi:bifunctional diguanylate cyclase/phosphodiesterase [Chitinibacter tainanensis]|uniref:putative bifunctional diguanylate cyclase/phosphodiesterase n=1 Tax=Chitinibacter tainanensis TaxID=230667 RepID=UPI002355B1F6|nr:EAL domain-containing protein [Chitinibacter tainanensis]